MKNTLSKKSKIWIYQIDRTLKEEEVNLLRPKIESFCNEWTAHDKALISDYDILYNRFIVLAVDETNHDASGCSIDKSVKFLKIIGQTFDLDVFARLDMVYMDSGELKIIHFTDIEDAFSRQIITEETLFFNINLETLGQLENEFLIPLKQHWLMKRLG